MTCPDVCSSSQARPPRVSFSRRRSVRRVLSAVALMLTVGTTAVAHAQLRPGAITAAEAGTLGEVWVVLANGNAAEASRLATLLLNQRPNDPAVLTAAIEADMAFAGWTAGLDRYESRPGAQGPESPLLLRRVAQVLLREAAADERNPSAGLDALRALAASGDGAALQTLATMSANGGAAQTRTLAELGDERAVRTLVADLESGANPLETLRVLGKSRNPLALPALVAQTKSRDPAVRQAAVEALGQFGAKDQMDLLRASLKDPVGLVRGKAAAALYRLGDDSGVGLLRELAASDAPAARLAAANYLSSRPDAQWLSLVRGLMREQAADVRLGAAKLLVEEDPAAAESVLSSIAADGGVDLALREDASRSRPLAASNDLAKLRALLRTPDRLVRIAAAGRLLQITR